MKGWLLDTNVVSSLMNPNGAPSVKAWARAQDEKNLYISVLTLAEYDKGIFNLAEDSPDRSRYSAARNALAQRFATRLLSVGDADVLLWGRLSGDIKRKTSHTPPVIDTLLAAAAINNDLRLVTRNKKDVEFTGAAIFDPWDNPGQT
ncbi:putative nucleic acid-binding protein [Rhizobium sp. SG_E_25_P2]|uniref:type II toxin-antitoxin system VapC family toxin n=1 Tax=Rhizobium sp. SG_E_25_P2 TaxID=2879942 RepID=UPI00247413C1|nr:type II toxin-antitoxin system VapC family toxin [Rhizobium sp. SG_E_25_P2]MDH6268560.1 putative nucleic acid-binding protein [Rhizobium sp. SG_E_25_P2]